MFDNTERQEREQRWAKALKKGDQTIMESLYDAYAPVLLGLISKIVRNKEISEAVLVDTFLAIWNQKNAYNPEKTGFLTWMILLAKETALEAIRSGRFNSFPNNQEFSTFGNTGAAKSNGQETFESGKTLCELKPDEKAALDLIYLKGYSCAEAAAALQISEASLKTSLKRAVKQLGTQTAS